MSFGKCVPALHLSLTCFHFVLPIDMHFALTRWWNLNVETILKCYRVCWYKCLKQHQCNQICASEYLFPSKMKDIRYEPFAFDVCRLTVTAAKMIPSSHQFSNYNWSLSFFRSLKINILAISDGPVDVVFEGLFLSVRWQFQICESFWSWLKMFETWSSPATGCLFLTKTQWAFWIWKSVARGDHLRRHHSKCGFEFGYLRFKV